MINNRFKFRAWDHTNKHIADFNRYGKPEDFWMMALSHGWDIMQCTGLEDKNGKLIYEGDIIRGVNALFKVEWGEKFDTLGWIMTVMKPTHDGLRLNERHSLFNGWGVIVGNIYENLKLLNNE